MSNYPAYPYHQELGELEAICRLDQVARAPHFMFIAVVRLGNR